MHKNNTYVKLNTHPFDNLPYYVWTYTFNTLFLDIIDKCHDRTKNLKILSLPEIQPIIDIRHKRYEEYYSDWSKTRVDVIYSGYGEYETEKNFYKHKDLYNHLNPNRHFFTLFFLYFSFNQFQNYHITPINFEFNPQYHFTSYNRNPRPHRLYLLHLLNQKGLLKNNLYSYFGFEFNKHEFNYFFGAPFDFNNLNIIPNQIDDEDIINKGFYSHIFPSFFNSSFQQVTETLPEPIFLTEKTFIPIFTKKPFIIYGAKNINKVLVNFGFKLYDEIFNYDFDSIDDKIVRANHYVNEIERVCISYSPQEIYNKLKDTAEYNYNVAIDILKNKKHIPEIFLKWEEEHRNDSVWRYHMCDWYYNFERNLNNY